jgi:hypothetical protein
MHSFIVRTSWAVAAAALVASGVPAERVSAALVTYGYSGTVTSSSTAAYRYLEGLPLTATFTVDTSVPMNRTSGIHRITDFNVLDASITVGTMTFNSKPFSEFDTNASATIGTNNNGTTFSPLTQGDRIQLSTYSNSVNGIFNARSMTMQMRDDFTDALVIDQYPLDLSAFDFGPGKDLALVSLGMFAGSTAFTVVSSFGNAFVVIPEPGLMSVLALVGVALRRVR